MNDKGLGRTRSKLGESLETCCLRRAFLGGVVFVAPSFNKLNITTLLYARILCYVTPSPANEIMNSRLDTKADEGIFEHPKRERGEKEGENIPKINFHLQGSCIFNRERLNIIG